MHYCYQIGSTFVHLGLMEDAIVQAMLMCDRVKVRSLLGRDAKSWEKLLDKKNALEGSTLGSLVAILSRHGVAHTDVAYLKWVTAKRNFFVHRYFRRGEWPGELGAEAINMACRRLLYLETIFNRAGQRIWRIFGRADLLMVHDLGKNGLLMMNFDLDKVLSEGADSGA
jgi:hypothetical protein